MSSFSYEHYVVCVWSDQPFTLSEVLLSTKELPQALHVIGVLALVAPHANCALHAFDECGGGRVLSVRQGVWRLHEPEAAQQVA